jgi:hypothetical protein
MFLFFTIDHLVTAITFGAVRWLVRRAALRMSFAGMTGPGAERKPAGASRKPPMFILGISCESPRLHVRIRSSIRVASSWRRPSQTSARSGISRHTRAGTNLQITALL